MGEEEDRSGWRCVHTQDMAISRCVYMAVARAVIQRGRFAGDPGARSTSRGRIECRRDVGGGGGSGGGQAAGGRGGGRETEQDERSGGGGNVKREHEGWREGPGRVRGWVGDWHLISGRMTAAASGSIRRPRGQCAGGSDPLPTPLLPHLFLLLFLYFPPTDPFAPNQNTPGRTELVCFVCRAKPFCSPPTAPKGGTMK